MYFSLEKLFLCLLPLLQQVESSHSSNAAQKSPVSFQLPVQKGPQFLLQISKKKPCGIIQCQQGQAVACPPTSQRKVHLHGYISKTIPL